MDPFSIAIIGGVAVLTSGAAVFLHRRGRKWNTLLKRLADERGWTYLRGTLFRPAEVVATLDRRDLSVKATTPDGQTIWSTIRVESALTGIDLVRAEGMGAGIKKVFTGDDTLIGVPSFDDAAELRGDLRVLLARLDAEARDAVTQSFSHRGQATEGAVKLSKSGYVLDWEVLGRLVDLALAVSAALDPATPDDDGQLLANVAEGPTATNRLLAFQVIEDREIRGRAALHLLTDSAPLNRMEGAMALADADALAMAIHEIQSIEDRLRGLNALWALDPGLAKGALQKQFAIETVDISPLVTLALEWRGEDDLIVPMAEVVNLVEAAPSAVRVGLALWLAGYGAPAESALLGLLADPDDTVAAAAARALGEVGTLGAVHPLMERGEGLMRAAVLKRAVQEAIAAIQARHGGAEPGGLALVKDTAGGELGLVDD